MNYHKKGRLGDLFVYPFSLKMPISSFFLPFIHKYVVYYTTYAILTNRFHKLVVRHLYFII